MQAALAGDDHAAAVRADQRLARELGITGVPFFVIDQRLGVSGAQPVEVLTRALTEARAHGQTEAEAPEGAACGPAGCD